MVKMSWKTGIILIGIIIFMNIYWIIPVNTPKPEEFPKAPNIGRQVIGYDYKNDTYIYLNLSQRDINSGLRDEVSSKSKRSNKVSIRKTDNFTRKQIRNLKEYFETNQGSNSYDIYNIDIEDIDLEYIMD